MDFYFKIIVLSNLSLILNGCKGKPYEPTWESLDKRPKPQWYDKAKIGIFLHWGVYSVPAYGCGKCSSSEWFWNYWKIKKNPNHIQFVNDIYSPDFTYSEFAQRFKAEFYDPKAWAELFSKSGAKYVVLTSKHHDGFCLWPSSFSLNWNSNDVGPNADLVGALFNAVRMYTNLKIGIYYSLYEWFNPLYLYDKKNNFTSNAYTNAKMSPELWELVNKYKPDVVWADGDWEASDEYWKSKEFLAWLYNDSPVKNTVVVNDRWGVGVTCNHGDYFTCKDRFNPGELQSFKWENAMTLDKQSWGYRRVANISDYLTTAELIETVTATVSCGGNILINVGPTSDGRIIPVFEERLLELGNWLAVNGEAIYNTKPWKYQKDIIGKTWFTSKGCATVYAITLDWPVDNVLHLRTGTELFEDGNVNVTLIGGRLKRLKWYVQNEVVYIKLPRKASIKINYAWVLKIVSIDKSLISGFFANKL